jgi:tryptophanyl-tRNA synthetase
VTAKIRGARTDAERTITYEPERRPEVANLLQIAALCTGSTPDRVAAEVSDGGASMLKRVLTDAVCDFLRPIQQRRDHYTVADALNLLEEGGRRANAEAEATLRQVRCAMGMSYTDGCVTVEA